MWVWQFNYIIALPQTAVNQGLCLVTEIGDINFRASACLKVVAFLSRWEFHSFSIWYKLAVVLYALFEMKVFADA